ncbi:transcriptional regulator [Edaphobacter acidisoli]|uniref:Transcriptional regulator n=1 Tax=Edaphobacter acidisoli TaxID=2040573 RepID=A0A916W6B1_9BACT|nr:TetR/AcrR family transcriptional regulator [Edaphobacter acidisoli]GGA69771.1 transcriptional regulator [Edaphobacter acidisoli]
MREPKNKPHHQDRSDQSRRRILDAAIKEFSTHGLAGARTDAIARAAHVNKALLYYYFKDKDALYIATIEDVMATVVRSTAIILEQKSTPGEQLLRLALNHFDRILSQSHFQSLMQQEMVRYQAGESTALPIIVREAFAPLLKQMRDLVRRGVHSRELVTVDPLQVIYSAFGANVFYFLSAPTMRMALADESFEPFDLESLCARRRSAIQFLANALFTDRAHGHKLARRVLADVPMPEPGPRPPLWRKHL